MDKNKNSKPISLILDKTYCNNIECSLRDKCERSLYGIFFQDENLWMNHFTPNSDKNCDFFIEIKQEMINEVLTYELVCDICGKHHHADSEFTGWNHLKFEIAEAIENGWLVAGVTNDITAKLQKLNKHFIDHRMESKSNSDSLYLHHVCDTCANDNSYIFN